MRDLPNKKVSKLNPYLIPNPNPKLDPELNPKLNPKKYSRRYVFNMSKEDAQMYDKSGITRSKNQRMKAEKESMLGQIVVCSGMREKRALVKKFNPHFYIFGTSLDPRNPYEEKENEL